MAEKLKAKFGDRVENGWASDANPIRNGFFVREFRRPHGQMNAGLTWEITDGRGKFWELSPVGDHKITVSRAQLALGEREITEEMVERARRYLRHGNLETAEAIEMALQSIFDPPAVLTTSTKGEG